MTKFIMEKTTMRKIVQLFAVAVLGLTAAYAQNQEGQVLVSQFAQWRLAGTQSLASGSNTVVPFGPCVATAGSFSFVELSNSAPVRIVDPGNPSLDETVTPTNVVVSAQNCTATLAPTKAHPLPYYLISGSAGLQEAVNATSLAGQQNTALLTTAFWANGGTSAMIAAATPNANLGLVDVTQAPYVNYHVVSSVYTGYANTGGAAPTAAAGAASGASPTIANTGNGNSFTVALTTGTATTTGTLFTEVWPSSASFGYVPSVTVKSVGANAPPAFTYTVTGSSTHTLTVSVTTAPTASTSYSFQVSAQ